MYLLVYVDDIILVSSSAVASDRLIMSLSSDFAAKDLGKLQYFLGLEVTYPSNGLALSQQKYSLRIYCGMPVSLRAKLPPRLCLLVRLCLLLMVHCCLLMTPLSTEVLLGVFGTLPSLCLMSPMQLTMSVSIFMHHVMLIGLLLSASCAMFLPLSHMVFTYGRRPLCILLAFSDADWASNTDDR
jgi:hypothetical protein